MSAIDLNFGEGQADGFPLSSDRVGGKHHSADPAFLLLVKVGVSSSGLHVAAPIFVKRAIDILANDELLSYQKLRGDALSGSTGISRDKQGERNR